ncbi:MAG TPA: hypothetical protein V6D14_31650 [Coleofasciculaceae cyanobacterium]
MINKIRLFLIEIDPTVRALKPQISSNLHQPLSQPQTSTLEASADSLDRSSADSLQTEQTER